jgi:hypothetical protein
MSPRRNWDSPNPSLASECAPPPQNRGGGAHSPAGEGWGVPTPTTGKKLSILPTLWVRPILAGRGVKGWANSNNDKKIGRLFLFFFHVFKGRPRATANFNTNCCCSINWPHEQLIRRPKQLPGQAGGGGEGGGRGVGGGELGGGRGTHEECVLELVTK